MSEDRCRLVLIANPASAPLEVLTKLAATSFVYSMILHSGDANSAEFAQFCEAAVPICREHEIPVLISEDSQLMGRVNADGLLLTDGYNQVKSMVERFSPDRLIGSSGLKDRHAALEAGEANPDFVLFGKPSGDIRAEPHPKNLALAQWWSEVLEIPCIVLAGDDLESVVTCAKTGVDFVAVDRCIFHNDLPPEEALKAAEKLLDEHAPRFEEVAA